MSLTPEEQEIAASLLSKATFPLSRDLFNAWCGSFVVPCVEIALLRNGEKGREIFLIYRHDEFFKGWHIPGSVIQPGQTIAVMLKKVADNELQHAQLRPQFLSWFEHMKGNAPNESARGHVISLVFVSEVPESLIESEIEKFFPLTDVPGDLLPEHISVIEKIKVATECNLT